MPYLNEKLKRNFPGTKLDKVLRQANKRNAYSIKPDGQKDILNLWAFTIRPKIFARARALIQSPVEVVF